MGHGMQGVPGERRGSQDGAQAIMYSGKHARPGGTGNHGEATALNEVSADDLRAEDALDRSSHGDLQRLLGSIHLGGIRLQSPFYLTGSRRRQEAVPWRDRHRDDTVPLVKCDTVPLLRA